MVVSKLIMLWKGKGSRADLDKYRSISLLSIVSRVVAKVVATRLLKFAEKRNLLSNFQWGFRGYRSTRDEILVIRLMMETMATLEQRHLEAVSRGKRDGDEEEMEELAEETKKLETYRMVLILLDIKKA